MIKAVVAMFTGDAATGLAAIDACDLGRDTWTRAMLWFIRSFLDGSLGDMEAMRDDLESSAAAFRQIGERWGLATSLSHLAFAQSTLGAFDAGIAALEESMSLTRELGTGDGDRIWLAMLHIQTGDLERARLELDGALAGNPAAPLISRASVLLANLARLAGDLAEAERHLEQAVRHGTPYDSAVSVLLLLGRAQFAMAKGAEGELDTAERYLTESLELAAAPTDLPLVGLVAVGVAELKLLHGAPVAAAKVLGAAHALRGGADARHPDVVRLANMLRDHLGEHFHDAYGKGSRLARAVAFALVKASLTPS